MCASIGQTAARRFTSHDHKRLAPSAHHATEHDYAGDSRARARPVAVVGSGRTGAGLRPVTSPIRRMSLRLE